jgi:hypothetical protein
VLGQEPDAGVLVERRGDQRDLDLPGHERQLVRGGARDRSSPPPAAPTRPSSALTGPVTLTASATVQSACPLQLRLARPGLLRQGVFRMDPATGGPSTPARPSPALHRRFVARRD